MKYIFEILFKTVNYKSKIRILCSICAWVINTGRTTGCMVLEVAQHQLIKIKTGLANQIAYPIYTVVLYIEKMNEMTQKAKQMK